MLLQQNYLDVPDKSFDITRDGDNFLVLKRFSYKNTIFSLNVIVNWFEEVKALVK